MTDSERPQSAQGGEVPTAAALSVQEAATLLAKGRELQDKLGPRVARMMSLTEDDLKVRSR